MALTDVLIVVRLRKFNLRSGPRTSQHTGSKSILNIYTNENDSSPVKTPLHSLLILLPLVFLS